MNHNCKKILMTLFALAVVFHGKQSNADLLWDNGTYSGVNPSLSFGWNQSASTPFRFALTDDFVLNECVTLTSVTCYGHMTGNTVNQPQVIAGYVRILADNGGAPGAVLFGDFETPLAVAETFTGDFHSGSSSSPTYSVRINLPDWELCAGTYWVQYNVDNNDVRPSNGSLTGNYFSSLVASPPPEANGYHYVVLTGQYFILNDPDSGQGNAPPFQLFGDLAPACDVLGDFNDNGACDGGDIATFVDVLLNGPYDPCGDFDNSSTVDLSDVAGFVSCLIS